MTSLSFIDSAVQTVNDAKPDRNEAKSDWTNADLTRIIVQLVRQTRGKLQAP